MEPNSPKPTSAAKYLTAALPFPYSSPHQAPPPPPTPDERNKGIRDKRREMYVRSHTHSTRNDKVLETKRISTPVTYHKLLGS
jgi:hypothetical protein